MIAYPQGTRCFREFTLFRLSGFDLAEKHKPRSQVQSTASTHAHALSGAARWERCARSRCERSVGTGPGSSSRRTFALCARKFGYAAQRTGLRTSVPALAFGLGAFPLRSLAPRAFRLRMFGPDAPCFRTPLPRTPIVTSPSARSADVPAAAGRFLGFCFFRPGRACGLPTLPVRASGLRTPAAGSNSRTPNVGTRAERLHSARPHSGCLLSPCRNVWQKALLGTERATSPSRTPLCYR